MFDIAPTEFLLVAIVALVVIGPKDLPKAMRFVGYWTGRARAVARQFRSGFDTMVREAELQEMEQKWAAENERIMREHPQGAITHMMAPAAENDAADAVVEHDAAVLVEKPVVAPAPGASAPEPPGAAPPESDAKAAS